MINKDELSYRRGTIVGLTMAEAIIIFVFILLLLLNHSQKAFEKKLNEIQQSNDRLKEIVESYKSKDSLVENVEKLLSTLDSNSFDDAFKELELLKETNNHLKLENISLKNKIENQEQIDDHLKLYGATSPDQVKKALKVVEFLKNAKDQKSIEQHLEGITTTIEKLEREKGNLQGQLSYIQKKLNANGKGTEKPACWASSDGRPEYIFNIAMESEGLKLHKNEINQDRNKEYHDLPTQDIMLDTKIGFSEFRSSTYKLYRWSSDNECRFFVKIFDLTGSDEKKTYKKNLRIIGEHFYYYEPVDEKYQLAKRLE
jgi:hypothetical protein